MGKKTDVVKTGLSVVAILAILVTVILMIMSAASAKPVIEHDHVEKSAGEDTYKNRQKWYWTAIAILIPVSLVLLFFGRTYSLTTINPNDLSVVTSTMQKGVRGSMYGTFIIFLMFLILTMTKAIKVDPGIGSSALFLYLFAVFATLYRSSNGTFLGTIAEKAKEAVFTAKTFVRTGTEGVSGLRSQKAAQVAETQASTVTYAPGPMPQQASLPVATEAFPQVEGQVTPVVQPVIQGVPVAPTIPTQTPEAPLRA